MQYAVFLRAINVGSHNRVRMDVLRTLCESLGYTNVATYLQTGNIVLDTDETPEQLTLRLEEALIGAGLRNAAVLVRTPQQLRAFLAAEPFSAYEAAKFRRYVTLLREPLPAATVQALSAASWFADGHPGELLTVIEIGFGGQTTFLDRKVKVAWTTRYWNVIEGVANLCR